MEIVEVKYTDAILEEIKALGKKNAKTLGLFPEGAFNDHARKKWIIAATDQNTLHGYLLYRINQSKRTIHIVQLCINEAFRNKGIASKLLEYLKGKFKRFFRGIALNCREDYVSATDLWKKNGFRNIKRYRSRSKDEKYLITWWYDFGTPDLFSRVQQQSPSINAMLDTSVIIKLRDIDNDPNVESAALLGDWIDDDVKYYYSMEVFTEIERDIDKARAQKTRQFLNQFQLVRNDPESCNEAFKKLSKFLPGTSENDKSDKKQLAECAVAGLDYLISVDEGLLGKSNLIYEIFGLQVVRPTDFILIMDHQLNNNNYYEFKRVAGVSNYLQVNIEPNEIQYLTSIFQDKKLGEKKHTLRDKITAIVSNKRQGVFKIIKNIEQNPIAIWGGFKKGDCFNVEILRTVNHKLSKTLLNQIISDVMRVCRDKKINLIIISDQILDKESEFIISNLGFKKKENGWIKLSFYELTTFEKIVHSNSLFKEYFDVVNIKRFLDAYSNTFHIDDLKLTVERMLFPCKFVDVNIPTYIIPIKPYWASQLFDHMIASVDIFGSSPKLMWNRENVYYRSVKPVNEKVPSRILWYSSNDKFKTDRKKAIVACSYLDEVIIGSAKNIFSKLKHYGIYEWNHIFELAKKDAYKEIKAIRFSDTELFHKPVYIDRINNVFKKYKRKPNTFASPVKVNPDIYNEIYKLGMVK